MAEVHPLLDFDSDDNPAMRLPRVRFGVRLLILLVAAIAVGLFLIGEFGDGLPPRFVVRGIPARIAQLRPGMTWEQTQEILGLEQSWLMGGTGAQYGGGSGGGPHKMLEGYLVRPGRAVVVMARGGGGDPAPVNTFHSAATIHVWFRTDVKDARFGVHDWRRDKSTRLIRASFSSDSTTIAVMPGSFPLERDPSPKP